jgi:glycosyltransferase involved in cell wall biosynthesis
VLGESRVIVVVPAYEEAARIRCVLSTMPPFVDRVLVVDDASNDATGARAAEVGDPRVEVIRHAMNRGVGAAIVSGYRRALELGGSPNDAFVVMAGDGQMAPEDLSSVALPVTQGKADYVKGNRFAAPDHAAAMPAARRAGGLVFSWLTARATGLPISDSQCGYTALRRGACESLDLEGLWPRFGYPNDLLGQVAVRRLRVVEVPVRAVYAGERSKLRAWHLPVIALLVGRAWVRRMRSEATAERRAREPRPHSRREGGLAVLDRTGRLEKVPE